MHRVLGAALVAALLFAAPALAHDRYSGWQRPDGQGGCCDMTDCRSVPWRYDGQQLMLEIEGAWIAADPAATLSRPSNDGTAHACWKPPYWHGGLKLLPKPHCIQQPGGAT